MLQPKLPKICARCGSRQGTSFWEIKGQVETLDSVTLVTIWLGFLLFRRCSYCFSLPVCKPCRAVLEKSQKVSITIKLIGVVLGIILLGIYARFFVRNEPIGTLIFSTVTFGGLIGYALGSIVGGIIKLRSSSYICSFNGRYFQFKNKNFHHQFAIMNPTLVKK